MDRLAPCRPTIPQTCLRPEPERSVGWRSHRNGARNGGRRPGDDRPLCDRWFHHSRGSVARGPPAHPVWGGAVRFFPPRMPSRVRQMSVWDRLPSFAVAPRGGRVLAELYVNQARLFNFNDLPAAAAGNVVPAGREFGPPQVAFDQSGQRLGDHDAKGPLFVLLK